MQRTHRAEGALRIAALLFTAALVASACLGAMTPAPTILPAASASATVTVGTSAAASSAATTSPAGTPGPLRIDLRNVAGGFDQPVFATHAGDDSGRLFVVEQSGHIRVVRDGTVLSSPFLDLSGRVSCCGERGLLGLALAPGFGQTSGAFFVDYTDQNGATVIGRGSVARNGAADVANADVQVLLKIDQPFPNHNGGALGFGPDGLLYISSGDGGSGGDPQGNGRRLDTFLAKILRIEIDVATGSSAPYEVPADNPFVGVAGAKPEIWLTGLRNPWRMRFDDATGDLWIGDVGQGAWEEIDVARAGERGLDYGWNVMEGFHCFKPAQGCDPAGLTLPLAEYGHDQGCAVIGGVVVRDPAQAGLNGGYLFGDACSDNLWLMDPSGDGEREPFIVAKMGRSLSSIGEGEDGAVYATSLSPGELLRITAGGR